MNRSVLRAVTLFAWVLACVSALAACGSDDGSESTGPKRVLEQAFATSATDVKSGRLNVDVKLDPEGLLALAGPITAKVTGPFTVGAGGAPSFDLDADLLIAGKRLSAGALSDGKQVFVELDGDNYVLEDGVLDKLSSGEAAAGIITLGIDPRRWITDAQDKGTQQVSGVETQRITGGIDAPKLLEDVEKLIGTLPAGKQGSAQQRKDIADAVQSASVEVWSGKEDKIVRQMLVRVRFDFPAGATAPIPGLDKGTLELKARIDDVNDVNAKITAPARSKPFSQLPDSGTGGLVKCLTEAIGKGTNVAPCATKLLG